MTETPRRKYDKPWAHVTDPQVGDVVRVKQFPGTNWASKRSPTWGIVKVVDKREMGSVLRNTIEVVFVYSDNPQMKGRIAQMAKQRFNTTRVVFEDAMPAPKRIPPEVLVALVKHTLSSAARV